MSREDPLERSVRLLDEALNSPQTFVKFASPQGKFSPRTAPSFNRYDSSLQNVSVFAESPRRDTGIKKLRRSELLDLSITIDQSEISRYCDMSNLSVSMLNDTAATKINPDIDDLLQVFQSGFQSFGSTLNVFDAISNFIEGCFNTVNTSLKDRRTFSEFDWLVNELNTWRLVNALYKDRAIKHSDPSDESMMEYIPERSEKELQEYFYRNNSSIREAQIVLDWLERIARDDWRLQQRAQIGHYTDRTVAWENTLHCLQTGDEAAYLPSRQTVTSLDPDAPRRQARPLHDIDHEDDRRLLQQVFLEIRCGRLDKAEEHCIHCGQHWRASTLEGWRLFHDPNYIPPFFDSKLPVEGNPQRDIWKLCAWRLCSDPHTPTEERAVMGALCGHLDSLSAEAETWEDLLWAEMRVHVDIRVEQEIRDNSIRSYVDMPKEYWNNLWRPGSKVLVVPSAFLDAIRTERVYVGLGDAPREFDSIMKDFDECHKGGGEDIGTQTKCGSVALHNGSEALASIVWWHKAEGTRIKAHLDLSCVLTQRIAVSSMNFALNLQKTLETIFTNVKSHENGKAEGNSPLRIIQELIILDNIPELLERCSSWVEDNRQIQFLRFLSHLVLVLRMLGRSEPTNLGDNVIAAYVKALIKERNADSIAYYCSLLPEEQQIELFSSFMEEVGESTEKTDILAAAEKYNLNIKAITEKVVQNIRNHGKRELGDSSLVRETTEEDLRKISALDWMVHYRQQRVEAIWECNALIRAFISEGKLPAARLAHNKIPDDSISLIVKQYNIGVDENLAVDSGKFPPKVKSALNEFLCYKAYLDAQDGFNHWFHQYHHTKPLKPTYPEGGDFTEILTYEHKLEKYTEEYNRWKANMDHLTRNVRAQLNNIIVFPDKGWLVDEYDGDPIRKSHMEKLRGQCIPQVFILLHKVLQAMDLLDDAMGLFVLLMSEEYKFYEVFTKQGLQEMLGKAAETSFSLLPKSRNPFSSKSWPQTIQNEKPYSPGWIFKNLPAPQSSGDGLGEVREVPPREKDEFLNLPDLELTLADDEDDGDDNEGDIGDLNDFDEDTSTSNY